RWGGLATLLWCLPIFLALHLAGAVGLALDLLWIHFGPGDAGGALDAGTGRVADSHWGRLDTRPELITATGFAVLALELAVIGSAARLAGARARDYLALKPFTGRDLLAGVVATAAVVLGFEAVAARLGVSLASPWLAEVYGNAQAGGTLPLLVLTVVVVAPVWEEAVFRGFLFRGWSGSWLGPAGAAALTSALWTCLHLQYGAALLLQIFCIGLVFGWVRHRSGSALLTMTLHGLNNAAACIEAAVARW
ncbi:MAG: CPBP family intramembrane metalloprotease, partial [Acetobacteraceae bacterium]|nr:CPBP family intramembrane metalloprotease [Acetobacteraceae bacterium]